MVGYLYVLCAATMWGLIGPLSKLAFAAGMDTVEVAFWRTSLAGFCSAAQAVKNRETRIAWRDLPAVAGSAWPHRRPVRGLCGGRGRRRRGTGLGAALTRPRPGCAQSCCSSRNPWAASRWRRSSPRSSAWPSEPWRGRRYRRRHWFQGHFLRPAFRYHLCPVLHLREILPRPLQDPYLVSLTPARGFPGLAPFVRFTTPTCRAGSLPDPVGFFHLRFLFDLLRRAQTPGSHPGGGVATLEPVLAAVLAYFIVRRMFQLPGLSRGRAHHGSVLLTIWDGAGSACANPCHPREAHPLKIARPAVDKPVRAYFAQRGGMSADAIQTVGTATSAETETLSISRPTTAASFPVPPLRRRDRPRTRPGLPRHPVPGTGAALCREPDTGALGTFR
jgi:DME family drug/metabolite transporter